MIMEIAESGRCVFGERSARAPAPRDGSDSI
jgi:hypothetical protein